MAVSSTLTDFYGASTVYATADMANLKMRVTSACERDAKALARVRNAAADELTLQYGQGYWSGHCTDKGVLANMRQSFVFAAFANKEVVGTFVLQTKKPWAIDRDYFTPCKRPLYLVSMAVAPLQQRRGVGALCIRAAVEFGSQFPADGIFLDAFDSAAGAGEFYQKSGFRYTGSKTYRGVPLLYYEWLIRNEKMS